MNTPPPVELKSWKQWCKEYDQDQINHLELGEPRKLKHSTGDYVRAIQRNALEAAVTVITDGLKNMSQSRPYTLDVQKMQGRILSLIPQRKEGE